MWVGMGLGLMAWLMVIMGHRYSKSTLGANNFFFYLDRRTPHPKKLSRTIPNSLFQSWNSWGDLSIIDSTYFIFHKYNSDFILKGPYGSLNEGQIPPESPWHESFCFSAAQSMVGNTVLPSWVASKWSSAPHNLISIKSYLCIIFGAICIFPNTHLYLSNTTLIWITV